MAIPTTEEITEKLAQLKQYSSEFDRYRDCMRSTRSEQVNTAYKAMVEAEKQYNALSDWFVAQDIEICWDRERQEYIMLPEMHNVKRPCTVSERETSNDDRK